MKLNGYNTVETLFDQEMMNQFLSTEFPFCNKILYDALQAKLELDPEYEVWVPMVYCAYFTDKKSEPSTVIRPKGIFISNQGRLLSTRNREPKILSQSFGGTEGDYWICRIVTSGKAKDFKVHRALASSFLPVNELCGDRHPSRLQVNHLDGDKGNPELSNLEWATASGNTKHAYSTGLVTRTSGFADRRSKPVKGVIRRGDHAGFSFILCGAKDYKAYGLDQSNISACCLGKKEAYKNCEWTFATEAEIDKLPKEIPDEVRVFLVDSRIRKVQLEYLNV